MMDHLGNVRASISDRRQFSSTIFDPVITDATDYFPFGAPNRTVSSTAGYRYGFNGKELDKSNEFGTANVYDYGFRIYNPSIGRFLSVDPLTKDYPWYTPYQFAGNTPIQAVDLDGLEEKIVVREIFKAAPTPIITNKGETIWKQNYFSKETTINEGGAGFENYSNPRKYGKSGTLYVTTHRWRNGGTYNYYEPTKRNFANKLANETVAPVIHGLSSVVMPLINQAAIISKEGVHEGHAYDDKNSPKWARPYKLDDNWNFIRLDEEIGDLPDEESFSEGVELMNSAGLTVVTLTPLRNAKLAFVGLPVKQNMPNFIYSTALKRPIKTGIKAILPNKFQKHKKSDGDGRSSN
jgi:RHS repeat-associated protein